MIVERLPDSHDALKPTIRTVGNHVLDVQNWVKTDHVSASFDIHHDGSSIYLIYYVLEDHVRAVNTQFNSAVWEDSCVEFFFSLKEDAGNYYNFEFNSIGTVLGAYGRNRNVRKWLSSSELKKIEVLPSLGRKPFDDIKEPTAWSLRIKIPVSTLSFSDISDISGRDGHANFYKCGDNLMTPHFLSWKPVLHPTPDFHLSRYFGQLSFF